jgi:hypothetical protein
LSSSVRSLTVQFDMQNLEAVISFLEFSIRARLAIPAAIVYVVAAATGGGLRAGLRNGDGLLQWTRTRY